MNQPDHHAVVLLVLSLLCVPSTSCIKSSPDDPLCTPGERRCVAASVAIEQCLGGTSWVSYASCDKDEFCANARCEKRSPTCGNAFCDTKVETCNSCEEDCGRCCGNGICEAIYNESRKNCAIDCDLGDGGLRRDLRRDVGPCPKANEAFCGGVGCVDVLSNPLHCGRCDRRCWGACSQGDCTNNPVALALGGSPARGAFSCALRKSGSVACWGNNGFGQLGNGTLSQSLIPALTLVITSGKAITAGGSHVCVLRVSGRVACWGDNASGQLGRGTTQASAIAANVQQLANVTAIAAGRSHSCALVKGGTVMCWGRGAGGEVGIGDNPPKTVAIPKETAMKNAIALTAAGRHTCAVSNVGRVYCWGDNTSGQVGRDQEGLVGPKALVPVLCETPLPPIVQIASGEGFTCALDDKGLVYCWGDNTFGQLGRDPSTLKETFKPQKIPLFDIKTLRAGGRTACAITSKGVVYCWGDNTTGQVGDGDTSGTPRWTPVRVVGLTAAKVVALGDKHAGAITPLGAAYLWGGNADGELGDGMTRTVFVPQILLSDLK